MVLRNRTNPGLRLLVGIGIIALSIYAFYLLIAYKNSPQLFLTPLRLEGTLVECEEVNLEECSLCLPQGMSFFRGNTGYEFSSAKEKIRGRIDVLPGLPREESWRNSLNNPFIRAFLGDESSMSSFELMEKILKQKYNPTLMGAKAELIPPWIGNDPKATILIPTGDQAIVFWSEIHSLAIVFRNAHVIMLSLDGRVDSDILITMVRSITLP